ncbi:MAG: hypothetical protein MUF16_22740 [Burkholderiaceae bacterium]|jgi:hypothetical protein|nr:hypothetical protein [Burkholderiaceae bacterium]
MTPTQRAAAERLIDDRLTATMEWSRQVIALLRELLAAEPVQEPITRPSTPVGWSDTDWIRHLQACPPIAYAVRDTLYGTSKRGVLRFCAADEPGAFAVYTYPPQQHNPLSDAQIADVVSSFDGTPDWNLHDFARAIERAHGITGEPT